MSNPGRYTGNHALLRRPLSARLTTKLVLAFCAVAVVPLVGLVSLNHRFATNLLTDQAHQTLQAAADRVQIKMDAFFEVSLTALKGEAAVAVLAQYLALPAHERQGSALEALLGDVLGSFARKDAVFVTGYALVDASGMVVIGTRAALAGQKLSDDEAFRQALRTGLPYASAIVYSRPGPGPGSAPGPAPGPRPGFSVASPVFDGGRRPIGALLAFYDAAILQHLLLQEERLAGTGSFPILLDEHGILLAFGGATPQAAADLLFRPIRPLGPEQVLALRAARRLPAADVAPISMPGLEAAFEVAGTLRPALEFRLGPASKHFAAVMRLQAQPWLVVFAQPRDIFLAPLQQQTHSLLVWTALVTVLAVALALALSRLLSAPIHHLTGVVNQVSAGDLSVQADVRSNDEIGTLAAAFNGMTRELGASIEALQESHDQLERRVVERTRELREAQREVVEVARRAGMAEIASNVLHNVGNVLNSVKVTTSLLGQQVRSTRATALGRAVALLRQNQDQLSAFFSPGGKGPQLVEYLEQLCKRLDEERQQVMTEIGQLDRHVEHICSIIDVQQSHAGSVHMVEIVSLTELVDDALRIEASPLARLRVEVVQEIERLPPVRVDRHQVLQILINLLSNARHAVAARASGSGRITVRVRRHEQSVRVEVEDNGVGIAAESLTRIFQHGFTTRAGGHGFGLHSSALAAQQMGGTLTVHSEGPDRGARFTLTLPPSLAP
jgi:C4-dicarboxylate-specific signal transduction histidine kinase